MADPEIHSPFEGKEEQKDKSSIGKNIVIY